MLGIWGKILIRCHTYFISLCEREKGKINHIPYRNSLMTTILKDSLGGNCKTILIANASSEMKYLEETLSTMRFALRCAKVKNEVSKNEKLRLLFSIFHMGCPGLEPGTSRME